MFIKSSSKFLKGLLTTLMLVPFMGKAQAPGFDPAQMQLPVDETVRVGQLPNGLTYYIRHNEKPKGQADFYIAQRVGSIQEEDNQRGLAHFLEHMCFNGTKNFPGNSMIDWLGTVGVKFGQNLNAYTAVDETVYNISNVPVTRQGVQDSCLLILHDWANELLLEPEEIDKERGVIHQEWRSRNVGNFRILTDLLPTLYPTSKYAHRMPIGTMEIVDNFPYQALRDYYETWYRPDNQGIVVVGDIDPDYIEGKIKEMFSDIPAADANAPAREYFPVPDHKGTIYAIGKDPEMSTNVVQLMFISDPLPDAYKNTPIYLQQKYLENMISTMLSNRFNDIASKPDSPFAGAFCNFGGYVVSSRTKDALIVGGVAKGMDIAPTFEAVYRELLRAARGGFTVSEYERAKSDYLASMERAYNNRDSRENEEFVNTYVRNFLDKTPVLDADLKWMIAQQLTQAVDVNVINEVMKELITDDNRVVLAMLADKPGLVVPTEESLSQIIANVNAENIEAYKEEVKSEPLIENLRPAGNIVSESQNEKWGATEYVLSNGIKVVVKPTTFKADEILVDAQSLHGIQDFDAKYTNDILFADYSLDQYSLGSYTNLDLTKYLAGKNVGLGVGFDEATTDISGSATPKDLEQLFELLYMAFTDLHYNADEFTAMQNTMVGVLSNQESKPEFKFNEILLKNLYASPFKQMISTEVIKNASAQATTEIVKQLTSNPADFTFYIVGNVNAETLKPLLAKYIASLPTNPAAAVSATPTVSPAFCITPGAETVTESAEMQTPQTFVGIFDSATLPYDVKNQKLAQIAGQVLTKRLLNTVREDWGAVYSISASGGINRLGTTNAVLQTIFPMKPEEKARVLEFIANEMKAMEGNITADEVAPVVEFMIKNNREQQENNSAWLNAMSGTQINGVDTFNGAIEVLNGITAQDVMDYMKALNAAGNYKVVVLDPKQ